MTSDARPKRTYQSFPITDHSSIKQRMLQWASPFAVCCFLDNQDYDLSSPVFDCLLALGTVDQVESTSGTAFQQLKDFANGRKDWIFGHLGYSLTNETEPVFPSANSLPDPIGFPHLFFFIPELLIELKSGSIRIGSFRNDHIAIWQEISHTTAPANPGFQPVPAFTPGFSRDEYLDVVRCLQQHILRGDCYEINFCQEFHAHPVRIDPWLVWQSLSEASPNPFAAFYRLNDRFLLCASPERYLKKTGNTLISQPIKGTAPRFPNDPSADRESRDRLNKSAKDHSENVMVVDVVRNDLSKICLPDSVRVEELFGIHSFPQVFQMISSIRGELPAGTHWVDAIRATFPMGSMTGAPKNRVVGLIGQFERVQRGLFSGAVGYITPEEDFDFNVVIRSLLYNREQNYLSYLVGSGITFYSDPPAEYEECLLKAEGIRKALSGS